MTWFQIALLVLVGLAALACLCMSVLLWLGRRP
jgi:hypothetical protein